VEGDAIGLVGRAEERRTLRDIVASVRAGMSGALTLRGEAGIGKTALLEEIVQTASDFDVLRVVGIEAEMNLRFAALHQLLVPLLDELTALPEPQANALRAAFGMGDSVAADRFLVGLATLTLLATAATKRGVILVVDDAQWLDQESESVLAFVARRLYADQIGMFIGMRVPTERDVAVDGLPSLEIGPLTRAAAGELIEAVAGRAVDDDIRTRVIADARGNPLAIVELTRDLTENATAGRALLPEPLSLDRQLEARFLRQVRALPAPTQRLLLTAATDPTGDPALLWRAGATLDFDEDAAKEAEAADLINFGPPISFRHPLIREAIYHGAGESERRATHRALADAIDIARDPDRHAWHRAASALAPDEEIAAELEAAALRAQRQGGYASTAALLTRAAQLTPDAERRGVRLMQAAGADLTAGQSARAQSNLESSLPLLRDPFLNARARRLEGGVQFARGQGWQSPAMMLHAAEALRSFDIRLARETVLDALRMAVWFGKWSSVSVHEIAIAAQTMPLPEGQEATSLDLILDGLAAFFASGPIVATPLLRRGVAAMRTDPFVREEPRRMNFAVWSSFALGDDDALGALGSEYVALARQTGALNYLPEALHYMGLRELRTGTLAGAERFFAEETDLQQGRSIYSAGTLGHMLVLAWRGDEASVRQTAASVSEAARELRLGWTGARIDEALAVLELGLGNYRAATAPAMDGWREDLSLGAFAAADSIEAHVRSGMVDEALVRFAWLAERANATNAPLERGLAARSHALISDAGAEEQFHEAITHLREGGGALHVARAQLLYGEWLRRQKRRRDSREQLRAAYDGFAAAGALGFAERARVELLATGETARKRVDETRDDLTPQEAQIASLAAAGGTNPEIAAQLFISPSTVEYHLRKVYRKLGISSRRALAGVISSD
jgi:DNA-binding NarL/FixJ family response regulator